MMKYHIFLVILLCLCLRLGFSEEQYAGAAEEQVALLVEVTQRSLEQLKEVQAHLLAFRQQEQLCIQSIDDIDELYRLSSCAWNLLRSIQTARLEPYFRVAFIQELTSLSATARKQTLPPVCEQ